MKKNTFPEQEKNGLATAAGVVGGMVVGGSATYAATHMNSEDEAKVEPEPEKPEVVVEQVIRPTTVHNTVVNNTTVNNTVINEIIYEPEPIIPEPCDPIVSDPCVGICGDPCEPYGDPIEPSVIEGAANNGTVEVLAYSSVAVEGQLVDTADIVVDGTPHRYVDVDRDGFAEVSGVDANHDAQYGQDEIHELEPQTVSMQEFQEAYTTPGGGADDEFLALNDEGPDYIDDNSFDASGADIMV